MTNKKNTSFQKRNPRGMDTLHAQRKDRRNWKKSIEYRRKLISCLRNLNVKLHKPHEMKLAELEELVYKHHSKRGADDVVKREKS